MKQAFLVDTQEMPASFTSPSLKSGMTHVKGLYRLLSASRHLLCSGIPLLPEQAVKHPVTKAVMKPTRSAKQAFLGKAKSFRDRAAAGIFCRTGDLDFLHLPFLERVPDHGPARLRDDAFALQRGVDPIAQFDFAMPPVHTIVQKPRQGALIPNAQVIAFAIDELEQVLLYVDSESINRSLIRF